MIGCQKLEATKVSGVVLNAEMFKAKGPLQKFISVYHCVGTGGAGGTLPPLFMNLVKCPFSAYIAIHVCF